MNRFLLLALTAGLLSPLSANADDFNVRDTCGRLYAGFISPIEAHEKLGLPKISTGRYQDEPKRFYDQDSIRQQIMIEEYCEGYTGTTEVNNYD